MIIGHEPKSRVKLTPPLPPPTPLSQYYTRRITFVFIFRIPRRCPEVVVVGLLLLLLLWFPGKKGLYHYIIVPRMNGTIMVFRGSCKRTKSLQSLIIIAVELPFGMFIMYKYTHIKYMTRRPWWSTTSFDY